jgi:hypothetical protein
MLCLTPCTYVLSIPNLFWLRACRQPASHHGIVMLQLEMPLLTGFTSKHNAQVHWHYLCEAISCSTRICVWRTLVVTPGDMRLSLLLVVLNTKPLGLSAMHSRLE